MWPFLSDEQRAAVETVARFCQKEAAPAIAAQARRPMLPRDAILPLLRRLSDFGLGNGRVPEAHGGLGLDPVTAGLIFEAAARHASEIATIAFINETVALLLSAHAPQPLRDQYLPKLLAGELIAASANTEPSGGSDVGAVKLLHSLRKPSMPPLFHFRRGLPRKPAFHDRPGKLSVHVSGDTTITRPKSPIWVTRSTKRHPDSVMTSFHSVTPARRQERPAAMVIRVVGPAVAVSGRYDHRSGLPVGTVHARSRTCRNGHPGRLPQSPIVWAAASTSLRWMSRPCSAIGRHLPFDYHRRFTHAHQRHSFAFPLVPLRQNTNAAPGMTRSPFSDLASQSFPRSFVPAPLPSDFPR